MAPFRHVMDGYRVLDFTQFVAGSVAGRLLAEIGAEVIKVEIAPNGDGSRVHAMFQDARSAFFVQHNRGKKSLCVDPKTAAGLEILKGLIARVDVFIENFTPGVIGRIGLDYEAVRAINPRIVMCSLSSFGQSGPLALKPGFDTSGAAYSGILDMQGEPDGPPAGIGGAVGDTNAGVSAAAAIGFALLHRGRTGMGQYLDISLLDAYFHCHDRSVHIYSASKGAVVPRRSGNHTPFYCPAGIFKSKNRYLVITAVTEVQWAGLCRAMDKPELARDPRYDTNEKRAKNGVVEMVERWLQSLPSDDEAIRLLEEEHVPVSPVLSVAEAINHPHLRQRGTVVTIQDRVYGTMDVPASPVRFAQFPGLDLQAPMLGEHNTEILHNYLGYSLERIKELEAQGVIHRENR
jgi:crotonobetainyl-CoA:carnitine CoA-transferase CaiB-like acyl-CoA transferase